MPPNQKTPAIAMEIDRLATQLAKDPHSKAFMPLAEEYFKASMWQEAAAVLEDGLKYYPGFITAMVALGRAYDQMGQVTKAKAILEEAVKISPENLRAHRTLIKIYSSQGLKDAALNSCSIILAVNPIDEEALSARAALGGADSSGMERQKKATSNGTKQGKSVPTLSGKAQAAAAKQSSKPVEEPVATVHPLDQAATAAEETVQVSPSQVPEDVAAPGASPLNIAAELIENALHEHSKTGEHDAVTDQRQGESDPSSAPPPHARVLAQLETWLRTIESRRRDHAA